MCRPLIASCLVLMIVSSCVIDEEPDSILVVSWTFRGTTCLGAGVDAFVTIEVVDYQGYLVSASEGIPCDQGYEELPVFDRGTFDVYVTATDPAGYLLDEVVYAQVGFYGAVVDLGNVNFWVGAPPATTDEFTITYSFSNAGLTCAEADLSEMTFTLTKRDSVIVEDSLPCDDLPIIIHELPYDAYWLTMDGRDAEGRVRYRFDGEVLFDDYYREARIRMSRVAP